MFTPLDEARNVAPLWTADGLRIAKENMKVWKGSPSAMMLNASDPDDLVHVPVSLRIVQVLLVKYTWEKRRCVSPKVTASLPTISVSPVLFFPRWTCRALR